MFLCIFDQQRHVSLLLFYRVMVCFPRSTISTTICQSNEPESRFLLERLCRYGDLDHRLEDWRQLATDTGDYAVSHAGLVGRASGNIKMWWICLVGQ